MCRVVITGGSIMTPLGSSWAENVHSLQRGQSGIAPISLFESSAFPVRVGGQVIDVTLPSHPLHRRDEMFRRAARGALEDAGIKSHASPMGLSIGLGREPVSLFAVGNERVPGEGESADSCDVLMTLARLSGATWPRYATSTACSSGNDAVGLAYRAIQEGEADLMLCGAADSQLAPIPLCEFVSLGVVATPLGSTMVRPQPFDRNRTGLVVGEGVGMFVLESLSRARRRGARIRAEVLGYGSALSAYSVTREHPRGDGLVAAMRMALADARLSPGEIDYVNAHGTGTRINDPIETIALKRVFGSGARDLPVSSTKSMTGHLFAAAGAVELGFCVMTLLSGIVPPTINLHAPDPECDLDYVPNHARSVTCRRVMSNGAGFGGQNSSLIIGRVESS